MIGQNGDGSITIEVDKFGRPERAVLDPSFRCVQNPGYSLTYRRGEHVRFINFYRAADGSFTPGSKTHRDMSSVRALRDFSRVLFTVKITSSNSHVRTEVVYTAPASNSRN